MSDETWLIGRKMDASKKYLFVVTRILLFDFELFIGARVREKKELTTHSSCKLFDGIKRLVSF
jgi:hypothetical protein